MSDKKIHAHNHTCKRTVILSHIFYALSAMVRRTIPQTPYTHVFFTYDTKSVWVQQLAHQKSLKDQYTPKNHRTAMMSKNRCMPRSHCMTKSHDKPGEEPLHANDSEPPNANGVEEPEHTDDVEEPRHGTT